VSRLAAALALAASSALACASGGAGPERATVAEPDADPWQRGNRRVFAFNEGADRWVIAPLARGWTLITPETVRVHLGQFFANLAFPRWLVNDLLQGDAPQAGRDLGRFVVNTTVGIAGFFDPASRLGLTTRNEDFGQTLGVWGLGPGNYVMLPIFGPSNVRDTAAFPLDLALNAGNVTYFLDVFVPVLPVQMVNQRALVSEDLDEARATALDFYSFVRNAYLQRRRAQIENEAESRDEPVADDLYEVPEDVE
jgi:phospholipid-binding lipoprotein MlaA